jgi:hypothetical protein
MKFKNYIVTYNTYKDFVEQHKTNRIVKFEKISYNKKLPTLHLIDETFDRTISSLDFEIVSGTSQHIINETDYIYFFDSEKGNRYRLDLIKFKEPNVKNEELKDKIFISISYSLANRDSLNYDKKTELNEIYDLMSRIKFLLNDYEATYLKTNEIFMFGKPDDQKFAMYEYIIKICFPDYRLIIDNAHLFDDNLGFYIIKK